MYCRLLAAAIALCALTVSCHRLPLPSPGQFESAKGKYVVAYHDPGLQEGQIEAFLETADKAWLTVLDITGIAAVRAPVVLIDQTGPNELLPTWSSYYQYGASVHVNETIFQMGHDDTAAVLRHEFTHFAMGCEYGGSKSFVLTEGIAIYVEGFGKPSPYSGDPSGIARALGLTYAEVAAEWKEGLLSDDGVYGLYELSGMFTGFWITRFGIGSLYRLYGEIDCGQVGASVEAVCGVPFKEICDDFAIYHY